MNEALFERHKQLFAPIIIMDFAMFIAENPNINLLPKNSTKVFSKKINLIFEELQKKGDNFLIMKDITCKCDSCLIFFPKRCSYSFCGNVSQEYFGIILDLNDKNEPYNISISDGSGSGKQIDDPEIFASLEESKEKVLKSHSFKIYDDEKDNFLATDNYLDIILHVNKALEYLAKRDNKIDTYEQLKEWLDKFKINESLLKSNLKVLEDFRSLQSNLESYYNMYSNREMCNMAMREYAAISELGYNYLVLWLVKYENFYNEKFDSNCISFLYEIDGYVQMCINNGWRIAVSIFDELIPFIEIFVFNLHIAVEHYKTAYLFQENLSEEEFNEQRMHIQDELNYFYSRIVY